MSAAGHAAARLLDVAGALLRETACTGQLAASPMTDVSLLNGSIRLAASVHGPMNAPPILFLHGVTLSRDSWDEIKDRLMDRCCVWTLDFRGHGHSDRAPN